MPVRVVSLSSVMVPVAGSDFRMTLGETPAARAFWSGVSVRVRGPGVHSLVSDVEVHQPLAPARPSPEVGVERDAGITDCP